MKFAMIAFTRDGSSLLKRLCTALARQGEVCEGFVPERYTDQEDPVMVGTLADSPADWAKKQFTRADCLVFIGAVGIAVRSIAPCVEDKHTDPAVVVVDDGANFAVSLLSGHAGGANRITERIARITGAEPVITTSSDVHGIYAIDEWGKDLNLKLTDPSLAKEMAAMVLDGEHPGFWEDPVCEGYCAFAAAAKGVPERPDNCDGTTENDCLICVSPKCEVPFNGEILRFIPQCIAVGIGCRKGTDGSAIEKALRTVLEREGLDERAIFCIASIDLKAHEGGLAEAAAYFSVPFITYPSAFLDALPGKFSESEFVRQVTGTGNVCERAACAAARLRDGKLPARLLSEKYAENGVTVALAVPVYSKAE